jgi:hypothetical protein
MSKLARYTRKPETLSKEIVNTVLTIFDISAKSTMTVHRMISFLKLPPEIQAAIRNKQYSRPILTPQLTFWGHY